MEDISKKWPGKQKILVILAHPDDPEFFCGATLSRWAREGHEINYVLLTCGDKGINEHAPHQSPQDLCRLRYDEQRNAGNVIGVNQIEFLDIEDGMLVPDLATRCKVTRKIRQSQPDILVTCDPQYLLTSRGINHPDHRAAGQVVLDAAFPAAGNKHFFPQLLEEGLEPHTPKEIWISLTGNANLVLDISDHVETKLEALSHHVSQIGDYDKFRERWLARAQVDPITGKQKFEEHFHVINWRA